MRNAAWFVFLAAVLFLPDAALACSCIRVSPCGQFARTDAIFLGNVVSVRREGPLVIADIDVTRRWKGSVDRKVSVSNIADTSCSFEFAVGQRFLVYGSGSGAQFRTSLCQGGGALWPDWPEPDLPPRPGRVAGRVTALGGAPDYAFTPIPGKRVWLATGSGVLETQTDAHGRFTLDGVPAGRHIVRADLGPAFDAGRRVELDSASDCAEVLISSRPSGRLAGTLSSGGAAPVAGIEVYAVPVDHDWTNDDLSDSWPTTADDSGRFEFSGMPPGRYLLTVNVVQVPRVSQPFAPSYYPGVDRREDAVAIDIGQGPAPRPEPFVLRRTLPMTTISADIICRDGSMPRSGFVSARRIDPRNVLTESTYTPVDGRFSVTVLDGVAYEVHGDVLVERRDEAGRASGTTTLRTPKVRVEAGAPFVVRLVAPLDRCQETTIDGSRPGGR